MGNAFKLFFFFFCLGGQLHAEDEVANFTSTVLKREALEAESPRERTQRLHDNPALAPVVESLVDIFRDRLVAAGVSATEITEETDSIRDSLFELSRKVDRLPSKPPSMSETLGAPVHEVVLDRLLKIKDSLRALMKELSEIRVYPLAEDPSPLPGYRDPEVVASEALMLFIEGYLLVGQSKGDLLGQSEKVAVGSLMIYLADFLITGGLWFFDDFEGRQELRQAFGLIGVGFLGTSLFYFKYSRVAPGALIPPFVRRRDILKSSALLKDEWATSHKQLTTELFADEPEHAYDNFLQVIERLSGRKVPLILAKARCESYL